MNQEPTAVSSLLYIDIYGRLIVEYLILPATQRCAASTYAIWRHIHGFGRGDVFLSD